MRALSIWIAGMLSTGGILCGNAAQIVYDNTSNDLGNISLSRPTEFGDEIYLQPGLARWVTQFYFEYFGDFTPTGDEAVRVRFYANDGPNAVPGVFTPRPQTLLYDSGFLPISPNFNAVTLSLPGVLVPDSFTWTVLFAGVSGAQGDQGQLRVFSPPTVGRFLGRDSSGNDIIGSYNDFWELVSGTWQLRTIDNGAVPANFVARVSAEVIPEPGTVALGLVGGLLLAGAARWRTRPRSGG
jgi:hypothetical protein